MVSRKPIRLRQSDSIEPRRTSRGFMLKLAALTLAAMVSIAFIAQAGASAQPALPGDLLKHSPNLRLLGQGRMHWFVWSLYRAELWVAGDRWRQDRPFAFAVRYERAFSAGDLVEESVRQLERLGYRDSAQLGRWRGYMLRAFRDVGPGDELVGLCKPGEETRFYYNGTLTAATADPTFCPAFFSIWLSPDTAAPQLRRALFGEGSGYRG